MIRTIDLHSHILPGFDDGCSTLEETLFMVELSREQGIEASFATPHYSRRGERKNWKELQEQAIREVNEALGCRYFLGTGNELLWHMELPERITKGYGLTLAESRYVLVEFDPLAEFSDIRQAIRSLENHGYLPVFAHMERYTCLREKGRVEEVFSMGARLQMNLESLEGGLFDQETRWCQKQVRNGHIHFLASDMHRPDFRAPRIEKALHWLEKNLGKEEAERMTYRNPVHVLKKETVE